MRSKAAIQIKAAILLIVFALNTVVGFACAVGVNMGFNTKHHEDDQTTEAVVHIHKDGKQHIHYEQKEEEPKHHHSHGVDKDHHDQPTAHHDDNADTHKSKGAKDDCCNNKVVKLELQDKALAATFSLVHPVFFVAFIHSFNTVDLHLTSQAVPNTRYFVRSYHPPIPDIRIAIQSFQI